MILSNGFWIQTAYESVKWWWNEWLYLTCSTSVRCLFRVSWLDWNLTTWIVSEITEISFCNSFQVFWGRNSTLTSLTTVIWVITRITKQKMKKRWISIHSQRKGPSAQAVTMPHFPTVWKWHQIKFQVHVIQDRVVFLAMPTPQKNLVWRGRKITIVKVEYPLQYSTLIKFKLLQRQRCLWKTRSFICFKRTFHRH